MVLSRWHYSHRYSGTVKT